MYPDGYQPLRSQILSSLSPKRRVFVSYHHQDQVGVDAFRALFGDGYDVFSDASLDRLIDSTNTDYVSRTIREDYITGTSITIVLCGADTWRRKYVDWEIHSTLDKDHALLGIVLPTTQQTLYNDGQYRWRVPDRLHQNIVSEYAHFITWPQNAQTLSAAIDNAIARSEQLRHMKDNSAPKMARNS